MKVEMWIIIGVVLGVLLLVGAILLFVLKSKKKNVRVDDVFITNLLESLGGIENIQAVNVDNGRLKFQVYDLEIVLLEELKKLSTAGVFVTGKSIKMLFQYDSYTIQKAIEKRN